MNNELTFDLIIKSLSITDLIAENHTIKIHLTNNRTPFVDKYQILDSLKLRIELDSSNEDLESDNILHLLRAECNDNEIEYIYGNSNNDKQLDIVGDISDNSIKLLSRFRKIKITILK